MVGCKLEEVGHRSMLVEEEHDMLELKMLAKVTFVMIGPRIIDFDSKPIKSLNFDFETKVSSKDS